LSASSRLLEAPLGHLIGGLGGVEVGLRQQLLLVQLLRAGARGRRLGEHRLRLLDDCRGLEIHRPGLVGPQAEARFRLIERGGGLADAQLEVGGSEPRQHLAALHHTAEVYRQRDETSRHLGTEHHLVLRRQGARHRHHVGQRRALGGHHVDHSRRFAGLPHARPALLRPRLALTAAAAEQRRKEGDTNREPVKRLVEHVEHGRQV